MSSPHIEYAMVIYADRLREAEHYRLVKKALAGQRKKAWNPIQALGQLVRRLGKQKHERGVAEQKSAALTNAG